MCLCVCVRICRQPVLPHASCIPHIPDGQLRLQEHPGTAHTVETTFSKHTLFSQSLSVCMYLSLQASQASRDAIICDLTAQIQTQMGGAKGEAGAAARAGRGAGWSRGDSKQPSTLLPCVTHSSRKSGWSVGRATLSVLTVRSIILTSPVI